MSLIRRFNRHAALVLNAASDANIDTKKVNKTTPPPKSVTPLPDNAQPKVNEKIHNDIRIDDLEDDKPKDEAPLDIENPKIYFESHSVTPTSETSTPPAVSSPMDTSNVRRSNSNLC